MQLTKAICKVMTKDVICTESKSTVLEVCKIIARKNVSCVIIKGRKKPRGLITERDIIKRIIAKSIEPRIAKASSIMSTPIFSIDKKKDLGHALKIMRRKKVKRLIVTSERGRIEGIITQTDVANALYQLVIDELDKISSIYNKSQQFLKDSVRVLFHALNAKDNYTGTHSRGVASLARHISDKMGLGEEIKKNVYLAGLFHDIGKIRITDDLLTKNGPLKKEEYGEIKQHPLISEMILKPLDEFKGVLSIIRHHHEWFNGNGYPDGIKGHKIPVGARVITVADSYNAMRTHRPYRAAMSRKKTINNIKKMSGRQFDPEVVKALVSVLNKKPSL